jgi:thiol-disulfide isomerase/thioredoxin
MKFRLFLLLVLAALSVAVVTAEKTNVYFFYGAECPHCAKEKPFLEKLEAKYPSLVVKKYEVWHNKENADFFVRLSEACGVQVKGVPATFIGDEVVIGFDSEKGKGREIEEKIAKCIEEGCIDPIAKLEGGGFCPVAADENLVNLPFFGKVDAAKMSLPLLAVVLGFADGFNACAMFVLLVLLGILLRTQSRKRMALVAGIFIFASGLVYFLFMTVWLNAFFLLGRISIVFAVAGLVAVIVGVINIKDFFFFGKGPSLKISEKSKKGIFEKIRRIVNAESLFIMIGAVIVLAVSVNFVEFLCTFGFPMVFTSVLANSSAPLFLKYAYLVLYQVFYMLDDTIIVIIAVVTLSSKKLTEKYGRVLKLIAGVLMLVLGLILLFKPELLMFG